MPANAKKADTPTGFANGTSKVPAPSEGATLYLKPRDDSKAVASVLLPTQPTPATPPAQ